MFCFTTCFDNHQPYQTKTKILYTVTIIWEQILVCEDKSNHDTTLSIFLIAFEESPTGTFYESNVELTNMRKYVVSI